MALTILRTFALFKAMNRVAVMQLLEEMLSRCTKEDKLARNLMHVMNQVALILLQ